jgi:hypothetical protein
MEIQKNISIQLFDEEGRILSERLVKQDPEFAVGPKDKHEGPLRLQFTLLESGDVDKAITYLQKLSGALPLTSPNKPKGRVPGAKITAEDVNRYEVLLNEAITLYGDNQDKLITFLREMGYLFVTGEFLKLVIPETYEIRERYLKDYQFLVKRIKEAKDPRNDKFDPVLIFGIKIIEERSPRILTIMNGEVSKRVVDLPTEKAMTVKSTNLLKYPAYMTEEERYKFGIEHRTLFKDPTKKPTKFYLRWYKDVKVGDELKFNVKARLTE